MKKMKQTLSVFLTFAMLFTSTAWTGASAQPDPFDEAAMADEAISIALVENLVYSMGLFFEHEPTLEYGSFVEDGSSLGIRQALAGIILPYETGSLSNLSSYLLGENYLQTDVDNFVADWAVAFTYLPLSEIRQMVIAGQTVFTDLLSPALDTSMVISALDYYENICADIVQQTGLAGTIGPIAESAVQWTLAAYLQNLAALNEITPPAPPSLPEPFDERAMMEEAFAVALFESYVDSLGLTFKHFPDRSHSDFWTAMLGEGGVWSLEGFPQIATMLHIFKMGHLSNLSKALVREEYTQVDADAFTQNMAEVFANKSVANIRFVLMLAPQDKLEVLGEWLALPSVSTTDIEDMAETVLAYYGTMFALLGLDQSPEMLAMLSWVVAAYLHHLAEINGVAVAPGAPDKPMPDSISNYESKEALITEGIQIGFAAAEAAQAEELFHFDPEEFDAGELDIDEGIMVSLIEAIIPHDMSELGALFSYVWLGNDGANSLGSLLMVIGLAFLVSEGEPDLNDVAEFVDAILSANLGLLLEEIELGLGEELNNVLTEVLAQTLLDVISYYANILDEIRQEVGPLFVSGDDTLEHVLQWVISLCVQAMAEDLGPLLEALGIVIEPAGAMGMLAGLASGETLSGVLTAAGFEAASGANASRGANRAATGVREMQDAAFDAVRGAVLDMAAGFSVGDVWALVGYCIEAFPEAQGTIAALLSEEQLTRAMDARQEVTRANDPGCGEFFGLLWDLFVNFVSCTGELIDIFGGGCVPIVPVTSVTVTGASSVGVGRTIQLTATVLPINATNRTVTWSTSNNRATVSQSGVVTGVSTGDVTIYATADGETRSKTITVNTYHRRTDLKNFTVGTAAQNMVPQGFAVGTHYCYSIESNSAAPLPARDTEHNLYRYRLDGTGNGGKLELMTNLHPVTKAPLANPNKVALGHANDMALVSSTDGRLYLYVVNGSKLVKLEYSGNQYWRVATYNLDRAYGGISLMGYTNHLVYGPLVQFILRSGDSYYTASISRDHEDLNNTPAVNPTLRFTNLSTNFSSPTAYIHYANQAIHYELGVNRLYVLKWGFNDNVQNASDNPRKNHANVALVYGNISAFSPSYVKAIDINKGTSNTIKFEIEGIGFPVGSNTLWFHTYEWIYSPNNVGLNGGIYTDSQSIK